VTSTNNSQPFVTKLDPTGTKILFTAVGVGGSQIPPGSPGDIFVEGSTANNQYPTSPGAFQTSFAPSLTCGSEGFCMPSAVPYVTHLSADGSKLLYSTFLGGSSFNSAMGGRSVDRDHNWSESASDTGSPDYRSRPGRAGVEHHDRRRPCGSTE
jgi:hypothetical protein